MIGNYCQESTSQKFQLPRLAYPAHQQQLTTTLPVLSWHPPLPLFGNQLNYALKLVELEDNQTPIEAINTNLPLLERYRLKSLSLPYSAAGIPLQKDKKYVWQVTAYWMDAEMGKTDIWEFSLIDKELEEQPPKTEAFRWVKRKLDGSFYVFTDQVYFAYDNRSYDKILNYKIYPRNQKNKVRKSKKPIELEPGINQITLDAKQLKLRRDTDYLLEITDSKRTKYYLEFKYAKKR